MSVECVLKNAVTTQGKSPYWDAETDTLLYVDKDGKELHRWNSKTGENQKLHFDETVNFVVPCLKGGYMIGLGKTLAHVDWDTHKTAVLHEVDKGTKNRINDGKCDAKGRIWTGTMGMINSMSPLSVEEKGHLFSMELDGSLRTHLDNVSISNGLAWSVDNKTMYYIDTVPRHVYAFDFDIESGKISNKRIAADFSNQPVEDMGYPDGMNIDTDGMIWVAGYGSGKVFQINPNTGEKLKVIDIPAAGVTSCCFGGKNYDEMYVTTTSDNIDKYPLAGSVFKVKGLGVKGYPANIYQGNIIQ